MRKVLIIATGLVIGTLLPDSASAASMVELERRIEELEQMVAAMSKTQPVSDAPGIADSVRATKPVKTSSGSGGFSLRGNDETFELKWRGLMEMDARLEIDSNADRATYQVRRVQPTLEGKLGDFAFRITPEIGNGGSDLVDGYIDWATSETVVLRAGQFKAPVGLERLQSPTAIAFMERAFPTELAPNRDRGLALYTSLLDRRLSLEFASTNGAADGRDANNAVFDSEPELNARVFFEAVPGIGFGVAGSYGDKSSEHDTQPLSTTRMNAFLPRYRSPAQTQIFAYNNDAVAAGDHARWSPQAYAYRGSFGVMAEYIESIQEVGIEDRTHEFTNKAAQITGVWAITGEQESFRGIKPMAGNSAWELALRYATLDIDPSIFKYGFSDPGTWVESANEVAVGINWIVTPNLKLLANYSYTVFDGGSANGGDRDDEQLLSTRLQFNY